MAEEIFTTAEIMLATGLPRGTITTRAKLLGYQRDGKGYTASQVYNIVTYLHQVHRKSDLQATKLRDSLNEMLAENGMPLSISETKNGGWYVKLLAGNGKKPAAQPAKKNSGRKRLVEAHPDN